MSKEVVAEVISLIELGRIAPEDIVKCLRKANSEPEKALADQPAQQDSTCNKTLLAQGKANPRTCKKCGLGPCIADRVQPAQQEQGDTNRLDWLNNNFFNRENLDWLTGNVSKDSLMWVFFAPTKVQGNIRDVLDAAINRDNNIKEQP